MINLKSENGKVECEMKGFFSELCADFLISFESVLENLSKNLESNEKLKKCFLNDMQEDIIEIIKKVEKKGE